MPASPTPPNRPAKTCARSPVRATGRPEGRAGTAGTGRKASLDPVRAAVWEAYRHLFPPHSLAAQTANGSVVISWSVMDDPNAKYPYAAPVMLRFDESLVDLMWKSDARHRIRIAAKHEATLREGLRGYDPFARFPNARVVVIG